jgi:SulP family sulfate permease
MLALTEAVSIARAIAVRSEQRIDGNQEFIGQGLANVVGSFFSSYASSGSFNRSGVNYEAGARTPLAAAFASVLLAAIILLVAPLAAYLPVPAMAGILFLVAWGLIDFRNIRGIAKASRSETAILAATFLSTLFLDLELAIYVGVVMSIAVYLNRTSRPPVRALVPGRRDPARPAVPGEGQAECAQLKIIEVHGSLFFGAIDHVQQQLAEIDERNAAHKHVLIVADGINFADIAGAELLAREARRRRRMGGGLYLVGLKDRTLEVLRAGGYLDEIGEANVFDSTAHAIERIRERLDQEQCEACGARVFEICERTAERRAPRRAAAALAEEGADAAAREVLAGEPKRALDRPDRADAPLARRAAGEGRRGGGAA